MSFFSKIISIALIMPIAPVFGMGRILAVLPLPYPLEVLEEKILFIGMERDEAVRKAPERRPLALSEKPLVNYEQQKSAIGYEAGKTFQIPPGLEHRVEFWKKIYGEYSTHQYVIHDTEEMLIYEVIDISDIEQSKISEREQLRRINNRLSEVEEKYHNLLSEIHRKKATNLTPEEKRIYNLFEHLADPDKFFKASHLSRIRAQLG
ncbi:MAG: hypothetical protein HYS98_03755 [Deltaproteobacteria bacterium]|nr:hypothetical protein [Deltaproteobacteria bacterium]